MAGTATSLHNLDLTSNAFQKCAPNLATNIKQCGTVTLCNAKPLTSNQLSSVYTQGGEYNVMEALFNYDLEIRMCEAQQNGLYDFFMSNKVDISHKIKSDRLDSGLIRIAPFVLGRQYSPINNAYWSVSGGVANGSNWQVNCISTTDIPANDRSFPPGERVMINGQTGGGTNTHSEWKILSSTVNGSVVVLVLQPYSAGSYLPSSALTSPVTGMLIRGTANVNDYEKFCAEPAAYLNWKDVPFWVETMRTSMCKSQLYDEWRALLLSDNILFRDYGDLSEIERNRQLAMDWQKRMVDMYFWGKAGNANQTTVLYPNLPQITSYQSLNLNLGGARCIGVKADLIGIYEQHVQCGRVYDLQGANLDLISLFNALYQMKRVREGSMSKMVESFDIFTDSITAEAINTAMIGYYNAKSQNTMRLTYDITGNANQKVEKANFGFNFRSYNIFYPNVRINVISHYFFDDYLSGMQTALNNVNSNSGRFLWVLDFSGIYPGIMASNRKVNRTGDLQTLAAIDEGFACVMEVPTEQQTLTSVTSTMVVECPFGNLLLENFPVSGIIYQDANPPVYPPSTTTTTTTSSGAGLFSNDVQSYTANCPEDTQGTPVTVTAAAGSFVSGVSKAEANAQALSWATNQAIQQIKCEPIEN